MKSLRIILVMIEPPLPRGNAAARWFYVLLRGLAERGHRVTAFATCSQATDIPKAHDLFPAPLYDLRCYPFPERRGVAAKLGTLRRPYSYMFSKELRRDLQATLRAGFDVLHLEQIYSAWLATGWRERTLLNVHHLLGIDLAERKPTAWRGRMEQWLAAATERRLVRSVRHIRCNSPRLLPALRSVNPNAEITTVPLGLDLGQYPYIRDDQRSGAPVIGLVGSMGWYPSYSAAVRLLERLWPQIRRRVPAASVEIVGWDARSALRRFVGLPGVTIEENVADVRPYLERTSLLLYAPARGSGMKVKVLEALASGVPIVTTSEGVEGLPAHDGVHAGICEDDAGLVERTVQLLNDVARQNRQRAAGRALVERHCGPQSTLDAIEAVYEKMTATEKRAHAC